MRIRLRIVRFERWLQEALPNMIQHAAHLAASHKLASPAEALLSQGGYDFRVEMSPADLSELHQLDWVYSITTCSK